MLNLTKRKRLGLRGTLGGGKSEKRSNPVDVHVRITAGEELLIKSRKKRVLKPNISGNTKAYLLEPSMSQLREIRDEEMKANIPWDFKSQKRMKLTWGHVSGNNLSGKLRSIRGNAFGTRSDRKQNVKRNLEK